MGLLDGLRNSLKKATAEPASTSQYPVYYASFWRSITWRCIECDQEIYWVDDDERLMCHTCETEYTLREDDFPELLRAKCHNCDRISESVGGFREENVRFDCPHCDFEWKSSPH